MPAAPRLVPVPAAPASVGSGTYPVARKAPLSVVVLDGDPWTFGALARVLAGCAVHPADSAAEALEAVEQLRPRVVVCGMGVPPAQLEFFARTLRARYGKSIPLVFAVTSGHAAHVVLALQLGARACIEKPFDAAKVRAVVLKHAG